MSATLSGREAGLGSGCLILHLPAPSFLAYCHLSRELKLHKDRLWTYCCALSIQHGAWHRALKMCVNKQERGSGDLLSPTHLSAPGSQRASHFLWSCFLICKVEHHHLTHRIDGIIKCKDLAQPQVSQQTNITEGRGTDGGRGSRRRGPSSLPLAPNRVNSESWAPGETQTE